MVRPTDFFRIMLTAFPRIATGLKEAGLEIPFICGGGAVSDEFVAGFDLGIWGSEAAQATGMAEDALRGLDWRQLKAKWNGGCDEADRLDDERFDCAGPSAGVPGLPGRA
jgi:methanol corrinoid protein